MGEAELLRRPVLLPHIEVPILQVEQSLVQLLHDAPLLSSHSPGAVPPAIMPSNLAASQQVMHGVAAGPPAPAVDPACPHECAPGPPSPPKLSPRVEAASGSADDSTHVFGVKLNANTLRL
eukprot:NODE_5094_length_613_cov_215.974910.p2 GENE.NODE_5094_length_613_cov_215.974910~~NODE_5094_length_613_cov_215.974910.p2  ORF type:complete len:121 (+),score=21.05 NODE_5094_length_613_cov_215.974910:3-365(+)